MIKLLFILTSYSVVSSVLAHPVHSAQDEAAVRAEFFEFRQRSIRSCSTELQRRGHTDSAIARRRQLASKTQEKRGLAGKPVRRRDFAEHNNGHASATDISVGDDEANLFFDNSSCTLQPWVTQDPYYVDGELIRSDVTDSQEGVPLYLDIQFIDTATCEPVSAIYIDLSHANSTGVYSGVPLSDDSNKNVTTKLDNTFLRGLQQTDVNGVVQFETVFPGHYEGRATHIDILSHIVNETLTGSNGTAHASYIGQFYFDQDLITLVEQKEPYASNSQSTTLNSDDTILGEEVETMDPFVQYVMLGEDVTDGLLGWISIGIDSTADSEVSSASTIHADGGSANENSGWRSWGRGIERHR